VGAKAETTHSSIDSHTDLAIDAINVVTGGDIGVSTGSDAYPGEGPTSDRSMFDFGRLSRGGALDDVFEILPDSSLIQKPTYEGGEWEVTRSNGGLANVADRVIPRRGGDKLGRYPRSAVIEYASPSVVTIGEGTHVGTFRQVSAILHSISIIKSTRCFITVYTPLAVSPSTPSQNADPRVVLG
jgi:hypothetical protein